MAQTSNSTHQGKVVSVSGNNVTSTCSNGEHHVHTVSKDSGFIHKTRCKMRYAG